MLDAGIRTFIGGHKKPGQQGPETLNVYREAREQKMGRGGGGGRASRSDIRYRVECEGGGNGGGGCGGGGNHSGCCRSTEMESWEESERGEDIGRKCLASFLRARQMAQGRRSRRTRTK